MYAMSVPIGENVLGIIMHLLLLHVSVCSVNRLRTSGSLRWQQPIPSPQRR